MSEVENTRSSTLFI